MIDRLLTFMSSACFQNDLLFTVLGFMAIMALIGIAEAVIMIFLGNS